MEDAEVPEFKVGLSGVIGSCQYELPSSDSVGAIVFDSGPNTATDYNVIIEEHSGFTQRVHKLHPCYMSLQFPLLFIYGQEGYHLGLKLLDVPGISSGKQKKMSINMYYAYQLHERRKQYTLLTRGGHQGDRDGFDRDSRMILAASFIGGPRPDVVVRMFEHKIHDFITFLRDAKPFGNGTIVLYTIEFQKRGLPLCHLLLWIVERSRMCRDEDVDMYISAELLDQWLDPKGYRVVSELIMHGP
ncbi:DNA helicase [Tanacetum coccineum]